MLFRFQLFTLLLLGILALAPTRAAAQSAVNVASFANPNLPNGSLAQGGMFAVFGSNLGPATLMSAGFPLPTELAGTSVAVSVGGTTLDCIMVFTSAGQVAAILPSNTPAGEGTMTVTYNGTPTPPFAVTVVPHSFGTFGINSAGSGPAVLTNATTVQVNTITTSAEPGEMWDIWGTGLGAVPFPDNGTPTILDLRDTVDVEVYVGGQQAQVVYAGRSGCCAGVDQIRFVVPAGLSGCYVPIYVVVNGVPSNFTSMSINPGGGACSDEGGIPAGALSDGDLSVGIISLVKTTLDFDIPGLPGVGQTTTQVSESGSATYWRYDANLAIRQSFANQVFTRGACTVFQFTSEDAEFVDPIEPAGLDAGPQTTVSGPTGTRTMTMTERGQYGAIFSSSTPFPTPFLEASIQALRKAMNAEGPQQGSAPFFTAGTYTYSAPGGRDVGAHSQSIELSGPLQWTNKDQVNEVVRSAGQTITWTPFAGETTIFGSSFQQLDEERVAGAAFTCLADGSSGSFTISPSVLQVLPASATFSEGGFSFETGTMSVGKFLRRDCQASGLDVCVLSYADAVNKQLGYR